MSELSSTTDAPPPPPPPPPPEIESREPDASPELAQALSGENQDANQTGFDTGGQDDAARMAQAQEQADPIRQDLSDYQQDPTEVPSGSLVSPDPVSDAGQSVAGSDGGGQDDAARMARAQEQADPIREQLQEYQQDNAVDGGPPDVSPELAEALLAESEPLEAPDAGPEPIVEPDAPLDETPDPTQASADADTESPPSPEADRADGADPVAPELVESAAEETPETETDSAREQLQEYQQDNAVDGGPPDVSPELAGALPDESELTADDSDDPVRQRKTWEDNAEGSDLPPSMKEDLRDLGNDLKEIIDPAAWEKKTDPDARKDMLNAANDRIREEYGLPQRDVSYRSAAEDPDLAGAYGYFDPETGGVVINSDYLGGPDPKEAIKTLAHENFHAYQDRAQYGDCSDPFGQSRAAEWQEADAQYPHEEDFDSLEDYKEAYLNNLLEKDARAVESEVYAGYREDRR